MIAINATINSFYSVNASTETTSCNFCGKVAKYTSSTKKGHLAGGTIAREYDITPCLDEIKGAHFKGERR